MATKSPKRTADKQAATKERSAAAAAGKKQSAKQTRDEPVKPPVPNHPVDEQGEEANIHSLNELRTELSTTNPDDKRRKQLINQIEKLEAPQQRHAPPAPLPDTDADESRGGAGLGVGVSAPKTGEPDNQNR